MRMRLPAVRAATRRRTRLAAAMLCCTALVTAGCSAGGASSAASSRSTSPVSPGSSAAGGGPAPALHWQPCSLQGTQMVCASLQVPVNYHDPAGRKITLALSMVRATAPPSRRQGDLLVNPGGPGAPGRSLAAYVAQGLSPAVASEYNIVGFDPRGVGASVPALHCDPSFFDGPQPDFIPASQHAEQVLVNRARSYAADCERSYSWLLPYMTTRTMARDMDSIRAALGVAQISYFGYSYGTYLGQVYATMFPHRIRRMVLDSVVDPAGAWWEDNIQQDYAFQGRMEAFFSWVASAAGFYHLGTTRAQVQQAWSRARSQLTAHPIRGPGGLLIGADFYDDTFLEGGYTNSVWPGLASALSAYLRTGATGQMISQYQLLGVQNENEFAVYNAVECADVSWPRSWATWNTVTRRVYRTAPFQAWDNAWFNAACAFWPVRGPAQPMRIRGAGLPGILMLQGTLDAATPYQGALVARRLLPSARMVVVAGGGNHGQSLAQPPNTCVNGYLNRYLATGALPGGHGPVNATCATLPPPAPGS